MNVVFIGGIPTVGKSSLVEKVATISGAKHINTDDLRKEMAEDPHLAPWVNFFWNKEENEYWKTITPNEHWENLKKQSEAFWPTILKHVEEVNKSGKNIIFEGVTILPHLAHKSGFNGVYLLSDSLKTIMTRLKKEPRWSSDSALQEREASAFYYWEQPRYKEEAKKYGFKSFTDMQDAEKELLKLLAYNPHMEASDVVKFYNLMDNNGISVWIDGGWSVDALLEKQTRPHKDLDIAIQWKDVPKLREILTKKGYQQIKEDSKWNFVLNDGKGHEIDVHAFIYDEEGNVIEGIMYPTESLKGKGTINGQSVNCISPEYMVTALAKWIQKWPEKYLPAISALCERFNIEHPKEYLQFKK